MKLTITTTLLIASLGLHAQTQPDKLSFALPSHPGALSLTMGSFKITELSAKTTQSEFGIRAEDNNLHLLGFLFLWPEKPALTSERCRDEMISSEHMDSVIPTGDRKMLRTPSGVDIALALITPKSNRKMTGVRAFIASGDLCGDLSFSFQESPDDSLAMMEKIKHVLNTTVFNPAAKPTFRDAFLYATVEWDHHDLKGAAISYQSALSLVDTSEDPLKWRRVTTDQLSMALGMSGDLKRSRAINEAAIKKDPDYPLYYFNLACADAEEGNATAAKEHLGQAYARKTNTLPGEHLPDPTTDDSLIKLKEDKDFWSFAKTLRP